VQFVDGVLFDPKGRIASDSEDQGGPDGYGEVEARNPQAGNWHLLLFSRPKADIYQGPITFTAGVSRLVKNKGAVSPKAATVKPGHSRTFTVHYSTPSAPGDKSAMVTFGKRAGAVPVVTEAQIRPKVGKPGHFTGALLGGNGRNAEIIDSQELTYAIHVPKGEKDLDADIRIAHPGYVVAGLLTDPRHIPVDAQSSVFTDFPDTTSQGTPSALLQTLHLTWANPAPGTWNLDLTLLSGNLSGRISTPVTGTVSFNTAKLSFNGVPDSRTTTIPRGSTHTATVTVANTGNSPRIYYIDPRNPGTKSYLLGFTSAPTGTLPTLEPPQAIVPPATTSATIVASTTRKVNLDSSPSFGSPEAVSGVGHTPSVTFAKDVAASEYSCTPTLAGPFAKHVADGGHFACAAFGTTSRIDDGVAATGGNLWDTATDPNSPNGFDPTHAVVVMPGHAAVLTVAFTPTRAVGAVVTGHLLVQNFDPVTFSSDEVRSIRYVYKVGASTG
jgi:hypothetical protein